MTEAVCSWSGILFFFENLATNRQSRANWTGRGPLAISRGPGMMDASMPARPGMMDASMPARRARPTPAGPGGRVPTHGPGGQRGIPCGGPRRTVRTMRAASGSVGVIVLVMLLPCSSSSSATHASGGREGRPRRPAHRGGMPRGGAFVAQRSSALVAGGNADAAASAPRAQSARMELSGDAPRSGPAERAGLASDKARLAPVLGSAASAASAAQRVAAGALLRLSVVAALLLSGCAATGSLPAFAPRGLAQPFFDGWFIRLTDPEHNLSCAVIVGSFRHAGASAFSEHYIALSYSAASMASREARSPDQLQSVHIFADPDDVQITLDGAEMKGYPHEADWRAPAAGRSRFFEWKSQRYGHLTLSNGRAALNFTLPGISGESVSLSADLSDAVLWGRRRQSEHGPEGWLGTLFSRRRPAIACVCARYPVSRMASQDVDG